MTRPLKPANSTDVANVAQAVEYLRRARELLRRSKCPQAAMKVRSALRSAEGALRHIKRRSPTPGASHPYTPDDDERIRTVY